MSRLRRPFASAAMVALGRTGRVSARMHGAWTLWVRGPGATLYSSRVRRRVGQPWDRAQDLAAIRATYDRYDQTGRARLWDQQSRGYARYVQDLQGRLLDFLRRSTQSDSTVVDLGCGTGELTELATRLGALPNWSGGDLREQVIAVARERYPHASWFASSADSIPLPDHTVDVLVAQVLFSSLPSRAFEEAVALEAARVLRPGGWLVWVDIRYPSPANRAVHGMSRRRVEELFPGWWSELELAGLLPPLSRRLGASTPMLYPALRQLTPLRSHLVGRLPRPTLDSAA
jgi:ubiquinone/menaquinone biosynthesis C-methylase UbiE